MTHKTRCSWLSALLVCFWIAMVSFGTPMAFAAPSGPQAAQPPVLWTVPDFVLTDQSRHTFRQRDLFGTVWVASFIYTSCPDVCPLITRQMAALRDALAASDLLGPSVRLVSFTVDPAQDSPAVLRQYAQDFGAPDPKQWAFLTGEPEQQQTLLVEGFHLIVERNTQAVMSSSQSSEDAAVGAVAHSNRAMVIDRCGRVRAIHPVLEPERFRQLVSDLGSVLQESDSCPSVGVS